MYLWYSQPIIHAVFLNYPRVYYCYYGKQMTSCIMSQEGLKTDFTIVKYCCTVPIPHSRPHPWAWPAPRCCARWRGPRSSHAPWPPPSQSAAPTTGAASPASTRGGRGCRRAAGRPPAASPISLLGRVCQCEQLRKWESRGQCKFNHSYAVGAHYPWNPLFLKQEKDWINNINKSECVTTRVDPRN